MDAMDSWVEIAILCNAEKKYLSSPEIFTAVFLDEGIEFEWGND